MLRIGTLLARLVRSLTRALGRGGGTTLPGRILLALDRRAIERLGTRLDDGAVAISATNGKTTTSTMLAGILAGAGRRVVRNAAGSNMHWGVATALLDAGRAEHEVGLFEVDEAWLGRVADELRPRVLLLANLFRDQLDRYGELEHLADGWAEVVEGSPEATLVLNADDPLIADLGRARDDVVWFGLADPAHALPELSHAADSKHCRCCGAAYDYSAIWVGHLGDYSCPRCGRARPYPAVRAEEIQLHGMSGSGFELVTPAGNVSVTLPLPGLYNVYNAIAAAAAATALGLSPEQVRAGLQTVSAAFGRTEMVRLGDRELAILLVKNPAGANEVIRTLALEQGPLDLWLALNDRIADGRDVSWIWDADFELLVPHARRITCTGTRAEEMALRLKYAGADAPIAVERDLERSLDEAAGSAEGRLYALPTYTALLELRDLLSDRGVAPGWAG